MKKLSLIGMGLVLLMAMTQCKKAETPSTNDNEGEKVHITLEVDNGAKNFVHPETGNAFFTNGDKVAVANDGRYVGTLTYNSSNRHFSGDITGAVESDYLHFYFMGNQPLVEDTVNSSPTSFTVNISDQTNCYPQIAYNHSAAFYSEGVTSYKAQLLNKCALVKFTTNEIPVETAVTVSGLNNQVSVNLGDPAIFTSSKVDGGNIALHAESATSRWAILLPGSAATVTASATGYKKATSISIPPVSANDYLTTGVSFTMQALPEGILSGIFSVSNTKQVYFSQGNLQSNGTFTTNQYEMGGTFTFNNYSGPNGYYILSKDEWKYLLSTRDRGKWGIATVNSVKGLLILPDNWTIPEGCSFNPYSATDNVYDVDHWAAMENAGAVFLPAAFGNYGKYWTSTPDEDEYAYYVKFYTLSATQSFINDDEYGCGFSVRLVCDAE
jgi:uncharacterized protein (TIGR02145 family)